MVTKHPCASPSWRVPATVGAGFYVWLFALIVPGGCSEPMSDVVVVVLPDTFLHFCNSELDAIQLVIGIDNRLDVPVVITGVDVHAERADSGDDLAEGALSAGADTTVRPGTRRDFFCSGRLTQIGVPSYGANEARFRAVVHYRRAGEAEDLLAVGEGLGIAGMSLDGCDRIRAWACGDLPP